MTITKKIIISLATCLATTLTHAQSVEQALATIEQNNLELQALKQEHEAKNSEERSRNVLSGPSVEYSPFYQKHITGISSSEFIAQQEFDFPTLYVARNKTAHQQQTASEAEYRVARRSVLWEAEQLLINYIELNKKRGILQERHDISQELQGIYEKRLAAGDATILEVNKIKTDCMMMKAELSKNEVECQNIVLRLQAMNGGKALELAGLEYPEDHSHSLNDSMIDERKLNDAELLSIKAEHGLATRSLKEAQQAWLPSLSVGFRRNTDEHIPQNGFLVGMSFPMYSSKHHVKAARARQLSATLREEQACANIENELKTLIAEFGNYQRIIKSYDLNLLRNSLLLLRKAVDSGEITVIEYYTEVERVYEQWISYINLEHDCHIIHAQIHMNDL